MLKTAAHPIFPEKRKVRLNIGFKRLLSVFSQCYIFFLKSLDFSKLSIYILTTYRPNLLFYQLVYIFPKLISKPNAWDDYFVNSQN